MADVSHFTIEVHVAEHGIEGEVTDAAGRAEHFEGWLALIGILQRTRAGPTSDEEVARDDA